MSIMKKYTAMASMMAALAGSASSMNGPKASDYLYGPKSKTAKEPLSNKQKKSRAAAKRARKARRK